MATPIAEKFAEALSLCKGLPIDELQEAYNYYNIEDCSQEERLINQSAIKLVVDLRQLDPVLEEN